MFSFSPNEIEQFEESGYFFPIPVLSGDEVKVCRDSLERFEASQGGSLKSSQRNKAHLLFKWRFGLSYHWSHYSDKKITKQIKPVPTATVPACMQLIN